MTGTETQKKLPVISSKTFEGYLILDYRAGRFRVMHKQPKKSNLKQNEISMKVVFNVKVPETPEYVAKVDVSLSQEQVDSLLVEAL